MKREPVEQFQYSSSTRDVNELQMISDRHFFFYDEPLWTRETSNESSKERKPAREECGERKEEEEEEEEKEEREESADLWPAAAVGSNGSVDSGDR